MDQELREFVIAKTNDLIAAPTVSDEAKEAAERWLKAAGTPEEAEETVRYIKELEEDILPIDDLVAFAGSSAAAGMMGKDHADALLVHAREIKAAGAVHCDCPACTAASAITDRKAEILK